MVVGQMVEVPKETNITITTTIITTIITIMDMKFIGRWGLVVEVQVFINLAVH